MIKQNILEDARRLIVAGADQEMILLYFRDKGFDKIDSINSIRALYGRSTPEAKTLVDHSSAWSDRFYGDMEFHEKARQALRDLAASKDKDLPDIEFTEFDDH